MESFTGTAIQAQAVGNNDPVPLGPGYDVFLIAGQSNTFAGEPYSGETLPDSPYDDGDSDIFQLGRYGGNDNDVILAVNPMDSKQFIANRTSWGIAFARAYKANGYLESDRDILLVHSGEGGTSFDQNDWNDGDANYNDAITRTNTAMSKGGGTNVLKGVLFQHGESDSNSSSSAAAYQTKLLAMIDAMRSDFGDSNLPFTVGSMVPAWVSGNADRETVHAVHANIESLRDYTGFADPNTPTVLGASNNFVSANHYGSRDVRGYTGQDFTDSSTIGLAGRHYEAYLTALSNN